MISSEFANMTKQVENLRKYQTSGLFFQNNKLGLEVRTYLNLLQQQVSIYRMRAIISRGLYIFYPIFHCGLQGSILKSG